MIEVSVIVPIFNAKNYILVLLNQLHQQNFKSSEFLLVDDGSSDNTNELIKEYIKKTKDNRFKLMTKENGGVSSARNYGLKYSKGEYVIFADVDDQFSADFIQNYFKKIKLNNSDIEFFQVNINDSYGFSIGTINSGLRTDEFVTRKNFIEYYANFVIEAYPFTYISKKKFWTSESFSSNISYQEDALALLTVILDNKNIIIHVNNESYYTYKVWENSALHRLTISDYWSAVDINDYISRRVYQDENLSGCYATIMGHEASTLMDIIVKSLNEKSLENYVYARNMFITNFKKFNFEKKIRVKRWAQFLLLKLNMKKLLKIVYKLRS